MPDHPKIQRVGDDLLLNFGEYGREVEVAAISQDCRRVLMVREVGVAEVWDVETRSCVGVLRPTSPLTDTDAARHAPVRGVHRSGIPEPGRQPRLARAE